MQRGYLTSIDVDNILVRDRLRANVPDKAIKYLAKSIDDIGLQTPISVRMSEKEIMDGEEVWKVPVLVTGHRRLMAVKSLGWKEIECYVMRGDDIDAELWEIAENLHRVDLTKEERDKHIRQYDELLKEKKKGNLGQNDQKCEPPKKRRGRPPKSHAKEIANATGLSKRTVDRALNPSHQPAKIPDPIDDETLIEKQVARLMAAWNAANSQARARFLSQIN